MKEPFLAHSELTNEIYVIVGKEKYKVTEQAKKAVKAVEKEPCEDCVSRQAAIDTIESWLSCDDYNEAERHIMRAMQSVLYDLPSVTPQETRWIPCSERMPKEREWIGTKKFGTTISDEVYVTLETINGKRFCDHIRFQNGKFSLSKQAELDAISKGIKPIAWMPKPKPYSEVKKDEIYSRKAMAVSED